jgi:hypothetical protein
MSNEITKEQMLLLMEKVERKLVLSQGKAIAKAIRSLIESSAVSREKADIPGTPAPLPAEVEEAMKVLGGVIRDEAQLGLAHRCGPGQAKAIMDSWFSALAVIKAAPEKKKVTRADAEDLASQGEDYCCGLITLDEFIEQLHDLGIEVEGEEET